MASGIARGIKRLAQISDMGDKICDVTETVERWRNMLAESFRNKDVTVARVKCQEAGKVKLRLTGVRIIDIEKLRALIASSSDVALKDEYAKKLRDEQTAIAEVAENIEQEIQQKARAALGVNESGEAAAIDNSEAVSELDGTSGADVAGEAREAPSEGGIETGASSALQWRDVDVKNYQDAILSSESYTIELVVDEKLALGELDYGDMASLAEQFVIKDVNGKVLSNGAPGQSVSDHHASDHHASDHDVSEQNALRQGADEQAETVQLERADLGDASNSDALSDQKANDSAELQQKLINTLQFYCKFSLKEGLDPERQVGKALGVKSETFLLGGINNFFRAKMFNQVIEQQFDLVAKDRPENPKKARYRRSLVQLATKKGDANLLRRFMQVEQHAVECEILGLECRKRELEAEIAARQEELKRYRKEFFKKVIFVAALMLAMSVLRAVWRGLLSTVRSIGFLAPIVDRASLAITRAGAMISAKLMGYSPMTGLIASKVATSVMRIFSNPYFWTFGAALFSFGAKNWRDFKRARAKRCHELHTKIEEQLADLRQEHERNARQLANFQAAEDWLNAQCNAHPDQVLQLTTQDLSDVQLQAHFHRITSAHHQLAIDDRANRLTPRHLLRLLKTVTTPIKKHDFALNPANYNRLSVIEITGADQLLANLMPVASGGDCAGDSDKSWWINRRANGADSSNHCTNDRWPVETLAKWCKAATRVMKKNCCLTEIRFKGADSVLTQAGLALMSAQAPAALELDVSNDFEWFKRLDVERRAAVAPFYQQLILNRIIAGQTITHDLLEAVFWSADGTNTPQLDDVIAMAKAKLQSNFWLLQSDVFAAQLEDELQAEDGDDVQLAEAKSEVAQDGLLEEVPADVGCPLDGAIQPHCKDDDYGMQAYFAKIAQRNHALFVLCNTFENATPAYGGEVIEYYIDQCRNCGGITPQELTDYLKTLTREQLANFKRHLKKYLLDEGGLLSLAHTVVEAQNATAQVGAQTRFVCSQSLLDLCCQVIDGVRDQQTLGDYLVNWALQNHQVEVDNLDQWPSDLRFTLLTRWIGKDINGWIERYGAEAFVKALTKISSEQRLEILTSALQNSVRMADYGLSAGQMANLFERLIGLADTAERMAHDALQATEVAPNVQEDTPNLSSEQETAQLVDFASYLKELLNEHLSTHQESKYWFFTDRKMLDGFEFTTLYFRLRHHKPQIEALQAIMKDDFAFEGDEMGSHNFHPQVAASGDWRLDFERLFAARVLAELAENAKLYQAHDLKKIAAQLTDIGNGGMSTYKGKQVTALHKNLEFIGPERLSELVAETVQHFALYAEKPLELAQFSQYGIDWINEHGAQAFLAVLANLPEDDGARIFGHDRVPVSHDQAVAVAPEMVASGDWRLEFERHYVCNLFSELILRSQQCPGDGAKYASILKAALAVRDMKEYDEEKVRALHAEVAKEESAVSMMQDKLIADAVRACRCSPSDALKGRVGEWIKLHGSDEFVRAILSLPNSEQRAELILEALQVGCPALSSNYRAEHAQLADCLNRIIDALQAADGNDGYDCGDGDNKDARDDIGSDERDGECDAVCDDAADGVCIRFGEHDRDYFQQLVASSLAVQQKAATGVFGFLGGANIELSMLGDIQPMVLYFKLKRHSHQAAGRWLETSGFRPRLGLEGGLNNGGGSGKGNGNNQWRSEFEQLLIAQIIAALEDAGFSSGHFGRLAADEAIAANDESIKRRHNLLTQLHNLCSKKYVSGSVCALYEEVSAVLGVTTFSGLLADTLGECERVVDSGEFKDYLLKHFMPRSAQQPMLGFDGFEAVIPFSNAQNQAAHGTLVIFPAVCELLMPAKMPAKTSTEASADAEFENFRQLTITQAMLAVNACYEREFKVDKLVQRFGAERFVGILQQLPASHCELLLARHFLDYAGYFGSDQQKTANARKKARLITQLLQDGAADVAIKKRECNEQLLQLLGKELEVRGVCGNRRAGDSYDGLAKNQELAKLCGKRKLAAVRQRIDETIKCEEACVVEEDSERAALRYITSPELLKDNFGKLVVKASEEQIKLRLQARRVGELEHGAQLDEVVEAGNSLEVELFAGKDA